MCGTVGSNGADARDARDDGAWMGAERGQAMGGRIGWGNAGVAWVYAAASACAMRAEACSIGVGGISAAWQWAVQSQVHAPPQSSPLSCAWVDDVSPGRLVCPVSCIGAAASAAMSS